MSVYALKNMCSTDSSSGGAFPIIVNEYHEIVGDELIIYGAAFVQNFNVEHIRVSYKEGIHSLYGSKYVQSDISKILSNIVDDLDNQRTIIFVGTPCQVTSIKKYLNTKNIDISRLLTIDLICHGTPKRELWTDYIKFIEHRRNSLIKTLSFRYKNGNCLKDGKLFIELNNGKKLYNPNELKTYMCLFSRNLSLNKCCFCCIHRNSLLKRPGDITIGDFWGVSEVMKNFKHLGDVSLILTNTKKANELFKKIVVSVDSKTCIIQECISKKYLIFNPHLTIQTPIPKDYEQFWKDYENLSIDELHKKYSVKSIKTRIKQFISFFTSKIGIKWKLKYLQYKIQKYAKKIINKNCFNKKIYKN